MEHFPGQGAVMEVFGERVLTPITRLSTINDTTHDTTIEEVATPALGA